MADTGCADEAWAAWAPREPLEKVVVDLSAPVRARRGVGRPALAEKVCFGSVCWCMCADVGVDGESRVARRDVSGAGGGWEDLMLVVFVYGVDLYSCLSVFVLCCMGLKGCYISTAKQNPRYRCYISTAFQGEIVRPIHPDIC